MLHSLDGKTKRIKGTKKTILFGNQKLDLETFPSFLKTNSKTNISLDRSKKHVYFVTSAGEIYSLNYKNRNINWLFSLTAISNDQQVDLFFSSPIINQNNEVILSSSLSTFSMNSINGSLNWEIAVTSNILPIVLKNNIILSSIKIFFHILKFVVLRIQKYFFYFCNSFYTIKQSFLLSH